MTCVAGAWPPPDCAACTAAKALTMPAPQMPCVAQSLVAAKAVAVCAMIDLICAGERLGLTATISAATPATCGAERLVPSAATYPGAPAVVLPRFQVDETPPCKP